MIQPASLHVEAFHSDCIYDHLLFIVIRYTRLDKQQQQGLYVIFFLSSQLLESCILNSISLHIFCECFLVIHDMYYILICFLGLGV